MANANASNRVTLGQAIRARRLELGLTAEVCAVKARVAVKTLYRIEADEDSNIRTLERIADALDLSLSELVAKRAS